MVRAKLNHRGTGERGGLCFSPCLELRWASWRKGVRPRVRGGGNWGCGNLGGQAQLGVGRTLRKCEPITGEAVCAGFWKRGI